MGHASSQTFSFFDGAIDGGEDDKTEHNLDGMDPQIDRVAGSI